MSTDGDEEEPRRRSGWLIPLAIFVVTAGLSALILLYYLAPRPSFTGERQSPTSQQDVVALSVGSLSLRVPANYLLYPSERQGGEMKQAAMMTVLPDFRGYIDSDAGAFSANAQDSPIVFMLVHEDPVNLPETERFKRIYLNYVVDTRGRPGPFGLTQYTFRDESGYRGEDLFVGTDAKGIVVMHCARLSQNVPSPNCLRDVPLSSTVALSYRFKRAHLAQWHDIDQGVLQLMHRFHTHKSTQVAR